jgi:dTDP-4-amino-4,6-dideoxygalactose transaminase
MPSPRLIPRYNWDYGFSDFFQAIAYSARRGNVENEPLERYFGRIPLFTTSGRVSLYTLLKSLGLPENARIGVPLFCCPVVFDTIREAGMIPVFIDIDSEDYNISPSDVARKSDGLSALVVVHMFGNPVDMDAIASASGGIPVIEDCAQSLFSEYKGRYTGFYTEASFFSFRSGKYLSVGEGSAIYCRDEGLREGVRKTIDGYGELGCVREMSHCVATYLKSSLYQRPWYGILGYPIGRKLDRALNISAKSGIEFRKIARCDLGTIADRLEGAEGKIGAQRRNGLFLLANLRLENVFLPTEKPGCRPNFFQFPLRFETTGQRDGIALYLYEKGVDTAKYLDEVLEHVVRWHRYKEGDCPVAETCSKTVLVVPHYYTLAEKDLVHVVDSLNDGGKVLKR